MKLYMLVSVLVSMIAATPEVSDPEVYLNSDTYITGMQYGIASTSSLAFPATTPVALVYGGLYTPTSPIKCRIHPTTTTCTTNPTPTTCTTNSTPTTCTTDPTPIKCRLRLSPPPTYAVPPPPPPGTKITSTYPSSTPCTTASKTPPPPTTSSTRPNPPVTTMTTPSVYFPPPRSTTMTTPSVSFTPPPKTTITTPSVSVPPPRITTMTSTSSITTSIPRTSTTTTRTTTIITSSTPLTIQTTTMVRTSTTAPPPPPVTTRPPPPVTTRPPPPVTTRPPPPVTTRPPPPVVTPPPTRTTTTPPRMTIPSTPTLTRNIPTPNTPPSTRPPVRQPLPPPPPPKRPPSPTKKRNGNGGKGGGGRGGKGSPLVFDTNNDLMISAKKGIGISADITRPFARTGGAFNGDMMLAMCDLNGNGVIDIQEVFGDKTIDPDTRKPLHLANGFQSLQAIGKEMQRKYVDLNIFVNRGSSAPNTSWVILPQLKIALQRQGCDLGFISDNDITTLYPLGDVFAVNVVTYQETPDDIRSDGTVFKEKGSYYDLSGAERKVDDVWF